MSVLIKGITMPPNCLSCRFLEMSSAYGDFCVLRKKTVKDFNYRLKSCPLIELPPHGRLIDADALMETFRERKRPTLSDGEDGSKERVRYLDFISTLQAIKDAPTIIETEEGE